MNAKLLVICLLVICGIRGATSEITGHVMLPREITGHVLLPGKSFAEAQQYLYSIHPAYCSCKTICSAGCYAESACKNCKKAVKSICSLLIPMDDYLSMLACKQMADDDLTSKIVMSDTRLQTVPLTFVEIGGFSGTYAYRTASNLNEILRTKYPSFFDCKKACMNVDGGTTANKKVCHDCNDNLCSNSGPCSAVGGDIFKCQAACGADMQFYDDLNRGVSCKDVSCNPAHVVMTAK